MNDDNDLSETLGDFTRRNVVKAGGIAGLVALSGGTTAATTVDSEYEDEDGVDDDSPGQHQLGDVPDVGGRVLAGEIGYPTIQEAYDAAEDGDTVYVHSSYDAEAGGEEFPIVIDQNEKEVALVGGHPSGSMINAEHAPDENVIEIYGRGAGDYRNTPVLANLQIVGGNVGIQVVSAPNAAFSHLKLFRTTSHGVHITRTDDDSTGSFGTRWYDCEAWSCGGSGFAVEDEASPHGTTFIRCNVTWNGWNGGHPGVQLAGYSSVWQSGTIQSNSQAGIVVHSGGSQVIRDTYFESNGFEADDPVHITGNGTMGLVVDSCYFLGGMLNPSSLMDNVVGHDQVNRAVSLHNARTTTVRSCSHRNHGEGFVSVRGERSLDNDLHEASHHNISDSDEFLVDDEGIRTRSGGVILPRDLRNEDGKFVGDRGIHDGSGSTSWGLCLWSGSSWVNQRDDSSL